MGCGTTSNVDTGDTLFAKNLHVSKGLIHGYQFHVACIANTNEMEMDTNPN